MIGFKEASPKAIPLSMLRRYLAATGWHVRGASAQGAFNRNSVAARVLLSGRTGGRQSFQIYVSSLLPFEGVELVVPANIESAEYAFQTARVVDALAELEERPEEDVVRSIREIAFDVVRSRIPDAQVVDNTIHLEVARNFVAGIRSVLAATATTELQPLPYFLRIKKEGQEFADHCRFGHTFQGSFGFTIESPLRAAQASLPGITPEPPFERRVMQRLTRGLETVTEAVAADSTDPITSAIGAGFSANVCEQLASLVEDTSQGGIIFDVSFSPEWRESPSLRAAPQSFLVERPHVEVIKAAAKKLRAQVQSWPETIFGRVIRLASDADPSDLTDLMGEREVAILWSSDALGDVTVRASLSPADYLIALEAHASGRPVEARGTLERRGRRWVLLFPTNVSMHSE